MRRILGWTVGLVLAVGLGFFLLQLIASETGEVVVLHTSDGSGEATTRLWVVEYDGDIWLRSGGGNSGWYGRLVATPAVRLERQGRTMLYIAEPEPAERARINALMAEKYGWRDQVIGLMVGGRDEAIAVRLRPVPA